jgi:U3 small nucleolar RNA-associated protein 23
MGRVSRAKKYRKHLLFYKINFGIEPPYKVLVDGPFIQHALDKKVYFRDMIPKILNEKAFPAVTRCIVADIRQRGDEYSGAHTLARRLEHVKCSHTHETVSANECIKSLVANNNEYFVGAMDEKLRNILYHIPGVPTFFIMNNMLIFDTPSPASTKYQYKVEREKARPTNNETVLADKIREAEKQENINPEVQAKMQHLLRKRKRAQGPNPLSVKKKQKKTQPQQQPQQQQNENSVDGEKKKRKRTRKRRKLNDGTTASESNKNNNNNDDDGDDDGSE